MGYDQVGNNAADAKAYGDAGFDRATDAALLAPATRPEVETPNG